MIGKSVGVEACHFGECTLQRALQGKIHLRFFLCQHQLGCLKFGACLWCFITDAIWMSGESSLRAISVSSCKHLIYAREEYTSFSFTYRICSWSWSFTNRKEKVFVFLLVLFTDYKFCSPVWNKNYRSFVYLIAVTLKSSIRFHVPYVILGNTQTKW